MIKVINTLYSHLHKHVAVHWDLQSHVPGIHASILPQEQYVELGVSLAITTSGVATITVKSKVESFEFDSSSDSSTITEFAFFVICLYMTRKRIQGEMIR